MKQSLPAAVLALLLTACGGQEDFSVTVKKPLAAVAAHFGPVDLSAARSVFPGIAVQRSRPTDSEILYTIPGDKGQSSTIRFQLEQLESGATAIHTTVDTLPVRATIGGKQMVLSEPLVEMALRGLLQEYAKELSSGAIQQSSDPAIMMLLMGLAVATNPAYLARAQKLDEDDETLSEAFAVFEPYVESEARRGDNPEQPMSDPDSELAQGEHRRLAEEYSDRQAMEDAAAPADDGAPEDTDGSWSDE